ncbi:MAG: TonB-dependent receptor, partial [Burkholderiaceae bacterium]
MNFRRFSPVPLPRPLPLALALGLALPALVAQAEGSEEGSKPATPPRPRAEQQQPKPAPAAQQQQQQPPQQLNRVEVSGVASDDAQRRASTASKIIIGREEIERYGDSTIGEVLKRLPGVTTGGRPGRGGEIRMRGMGSGYTQILVNGERMPPGFSLDQLPPDQIERIEVMRAPTAEYGARAIAGTINVVLREALQKRINDVRLAVSEERGKLRPNLGWTRNDKLDGGGAYNLTVNATRNERIDDINSTATTHVLASGQDSSIVNTGQTRGSNESLNLNGRVQWRLGDADQLALQPFVVVSRSSGGSRFAQTQDFCNPDPYSEIRCLNFDQAQTSSDSHSAMLRLHGQWTHRFEAGTRMELRGAVGGMDARSHSFRQEFDEGASYRTQQDDTDSRHRSWSLASKFSQQLANEHSLVGGLEAEGQQLNQTRSTLQNGLPRPQLDDFGDDLSAATTRLAVYAQDEWSVGRQWSFYAGMRGETIATHSSAASYQVDNRSTVWTPLLHGVWKFAENSRDQIRASLTRSYRSPQLQDLIARPSINSQYACPDTALCGPNVVNFPDRMGNPALKPEIARGLELAYENYLSKGGVVSANLFYRRIQDLIRNDTELEPVSWAGVPRWVSRPRNIGDATTMGIELEAKFRLDQFFEDAWPINVRSNLSLFHSRVDQIPGPHNTLDQQPRGVGNLGFDYKLRSLPLSIGASLNYTPRTEIQQTALQLSTVTKKFVTDAFALWNFTPDVALRVSATNLSPLDYATGSVITTPSTLVASNSNGRT